MKRSAIVCLLAAATALALPAAALAAGNIPTGLWVLDLERSKPLERPASQVMWLIKDDGAHMVWVVVATDAQGRAKVNSWDGAYDGPPAPVSGTPMTARLTSPAPGRIHNFGDISGVGPYVEDCQVTEAGKRFVCRGQVTAPDGVHPWLEDYRWAGPTPH